MSVVTQAPLGFLPWLTQAGPAACGSGLGDSPHTAQPVLCSAFIRKTTIYVQNGAELRAQLES